MLRSSNLAHAVTLTFGGLMIWLAQPGSSLFSYHPALMTLGLMVFILEGILLMKDHRVAPKNKVTVHWICSVTGMILAYLGFGAIYKNKEDTGKDHFLTWHGYIGSIALILLSVQMVGGIPAKYSVALGKALKVKPKLIKQGHRLSGIVASNGIFVSVFLALYSNWFQAAIQHSAILWWLSLALIMYPRLHLLALLVAKEK